MPQSPTDAERVEVPNLVGLTVPVARLVGHEIGIVVTSADLDGPPLGALTWPGTWVVTAQDSMSGHRLPRGAVVTIKFEKFPDDGGAGDREPRRPLPQPHVLHAERDPDQPDQQPGVPLSRPGNRVSMIPAPSVAPGDALIPGSERRSTS